jgi:hypothetical protein
VAPDQRLEVVFEVASGLLPVDNVRDHILGGHPWLAADPALAPWPEPAALDVVQTGAWILPDERPAVARAPGQRRADDELRGLRLRRVCPQPSLACHRGRWLRR